LIATPHFRELVAGGGDARDLEHLDHVAAANRTELHDWKACTMTEERSVYIGIVLIPVVIFGLLHLIVRRH
jgi:hypothetical protein